VDFVVCTLAVKKKKQGRFRHVRWDHSLVSLHLYCYVSVTLDMLFYVSLILDLYYFSLTLDMLHYIMSF
jgi:hypothetical protein